MSVKGGEIDPEDQRLGLPRSAGAAVEREFTRCYLLGLVARGDDEIFL